GVWVGADKAQLSQLGPVLIDLDTGIDFRFTLATGLDFEPSRHQVALEANHRSIQAHANLWAVIGREGGPLSERNGLIGPEIFAVLCHLPNLLSVRVGMLP